MRTLYVIPARGGSKGVPKKNIKLLNHKPLICYSIDIAREFAKDEDICVSTDSDEIISVVEDYGLKVHFKRPDELSTDNAGSSEVLLHALEYYQSQGVFYDNIMLLQPTSPFRRKEFISDVINLYSKDVDMVVSVGKSHLSPYFNLFEEDKSGFLAKSKSGDFRSRQEAPTVYYFNGSIYLINASSLREKPLNQFKKIKKYIVDDLYAVDIDSVLDWAICETIIREGYITNEND